MIKTLAQLISPENSPPHWRRLYLTSAAASLIAGLIVLIGMIILIAAIFRPASGNSQLSLFQDNWLLLIFKLHAGFSGIHANMLHHLNLLDVVFLAVVGLIRLSLSTLFRKAAKIWSSFAFALSLFGIMLFVATQTADRSTVMPAVLIVSIVMASNPIFNESKHWNYLPISNPKTIPDSILKYLYIHTGLSVYYLFH